MSQEDIDKYMGLVQDWAVVFLPKVLAALLIVWIGLKVAKKIEQLFGRGLHVAKIDIEVEEFLVSIAGMFLKLVVFLIAAAVLGVQLSSLLGMVAALAFAIGMALQGFLGNFAAGLTIIFLKPYRVGDWVEVAGAFGKVQSIEIFHTTIITPGDKTLIVPNGKVTDDVITNFSTRGQIRLELQVTMPYEESFPEVKRIINEALATVDSILTDQEALIGIESYDSHNVVIAVRPVIKPEMYWDARFQVYAAIKEAFNRADIKVAYSEGVELGPIGK